jgi:hypothetical protein
VAAGCESTSNSGAGGQLQLALTLPGGVTVSAVSWKVLSSTGATLAMGNINTSNASATPSVSVGVPPGTGDTVTMAAMTSTGATCSGTSAPFNVTAGMVVGVPVTVNCSATNTGTGIGSVVVTGTLVEGDNCPALASWSISPQMTAAQGGIIDVSALATDADVGETLSYAWSATAGSFVSAMMPSTQYTCAAAGMHTLTVTITDNHTPTPCSINVSFPPVTCL